MKKRKAIEHDDLEEKFQISTEIEFSSSGDTFEGLKPMEIQVKKKKERKTNIENVELRKSKGGLF